MSCDSGLGSSEESPTIQQELVAIKDGDSCGHSRAASQAEGHVHVPISEVSSSSEYATPVIRDNEYLHSEQSKTEGLDHKPEESNAEAEESKPEPEESKPEPEVRRGRGRPKGAKNKNPKPKPPPKPKRPKGRPRKYTYLLAARATRQHPYAKIEPVSAEPPDNIFED